MEQVLWYNTPPAEWMEGLPIGNGRLAAMVWGGVDSDVLSLNHEWLWRGKHRERDNACSFDMLEKVREYLKAGDFFRATSLANTCLGGLGGISQIDNRVDSYQPAGNLIFKIYEVENYTSRMLDLKTGVSIARRQTVKGNISSCFIAHPKLNNIICRWEGNFGGELSFSRPQDNGAIEKCSINKARIEYECKFDGGISYKVVVTIQTDGKVVNGINSIAIEDATELTAFINIGTEIKGIEEELNNYPTRLDKKWEDILHGHKEVFKEMMSRFSLSVELPENTLSTDTRIKNIKNGGKDSTLPLLYFNYGRYLLISSSLCGELPANLQGKWNDSILPPWECDYHFDINIQMNYWMAEPLNMSSCAEPLITFVERFIPHAKKAAKDLYGCRGVYLPLQTDAWGRSTPEAFGWAVWIGAAAWIAQHFWWHYEYNGDMNFLKDRAYPFFKEVARFYEDYLVEDEDGEMQIMPSQSPENRFEGTGMFPVSIGISSAMDVQLAYDALGYAIKSAELLNVDEEDITVWKKIRDRLPEFKITKDGRILEWDVERHEVEAGHRHLSHLYGLYPSTIFNLIERPDQYRAAIKSLEYRLSQGGGHTGWSRAWVACLFARIGNAERVWEHINALIVDFATVSLLDLHPPRIFQIDGNLGAVAAVTEALAQYWGGKLHLIRALPQEWSCGSVIGLKTPGGHTVNFKWEEGIVVEIEVVIGFSEELIISINGQKDVVVKGNIGKQIILKNKDITN